MIEWRSLTVAASIRSKEAPMERADESSVDVDGFGLAYALNY